MVSALSKFVANGGKWVASDGVLHISSPHLLTQIAGYAKFTLGADATAVHFRGQPAKYSTMKAGLYRISEKHTLATIYKRHEMLNAFVKSVVANEVMLNGTPDFVVEPLLQHYGMKTRWLDFVDNVWVALWFACHSYLSCGKHGRYAHFERRSAADEFAYIEIAGFSRLTPVTGQPGFMQNAIYEFCDLRVASPSLYIRPHAQHGVMVRKRIINNVTDTDCSDSIFGTLRIALQDALSWLGAGGLLSIHTLFPPPYYDLGYQRLLTAGLDSHEFLGSVTNIGP